MRIVRHEGATGGREVMIIGGYVRDMDGQQLSDYAGIFFKAFEKPYGTYVFDVNPASGKVTGVHRLTGT